MRSKKNCDQFRLLMWKNLCVQKKLWKGTIYRITYPLFFGLMIFISHICKRPEFISDPTGYPSFKVSSLNSDLVPPTGSDIWHLAYTPKTDLTNRIMKQAAGLINMDTKADLSFDTEDDLVEHLKTADDVFGGIVFLFNSKTNLPRNITYKIRLRAEMHAASNGADWLTDRVYPSVFAVGPREQSDMYGGKEPGYYHEGFLTVQQAVDLSIIKEVNKGFDANRFELQLKQYPHPPFNDDWLIKKLDSELTVFIMVGFLITGRLLCKDILLEKEKKLKEAMILMGMKSWIHWCSWFLKSAIIVTLSVALLTVPLHIRTANSAVLSYTFWPITFVFLLLYALSVVSFIIAASTLFSQAYTGAFATYMIFLLSCAPYGFMDMNCSMAGKMAASFDFNLALAFGWRQIIHFERIGVGMQFSNLNKPFSADDSWTMLHVLGMLVVDIVLYAIIAWYLDAVIPGDSGTSQPFYFPFMRSYWCGRSSMHIAELDDDDFYNCDHSSSSGLLSNDKDEHFEKPLADAKIGIKIRGLTKEFKSNATLAVNNLNLDMYEGYITALVGQNGAGKTTTMFMLAGLLPPTDGNAYINGMNIKYEMERIRENLGFCPQNDILFDWLTVREHLIFFAKLKGCPSVEVDSKVSGMLEALHLEDKADVDAINLSGGLKRKLCVGIALIADSKFVILDEPTSGMDPEARRQTWDLLQSQQKGRTIVLSTHYMDEADQLGDRIAIMADGQIQCYGTPMFLKNKYGIGYHLTILKNTKCVVNALDEIIKTRVPMARLGTNIGAEVSFVLPRDESHKFEELFARLEKDQVKLGIESFGVSVTTMEEVFLKIGQTEGSAIDKELQDSSETSVLGCEQDVGALGIESRNECSTKWDCLPFLGLLAKQIICFVRNWRFFLQMHLCFVAIILCVLRNVITFQGIKDPSPLYLNLSLFTEPIAPLVVQPSLQDDDDVLEMAICYAHVARIGGIVIDLPSKANDSTMDSFLVSIASNSIEQYNAKYLTGVTIEKSDSSNGNLTITGWFNGAAYHAIAISLSQVTNALLQCFGRYGYTIQTINHPLPWIHKSQVNRDKRVAVEKDTYIQFLLPYYMAVFVLMFSITLIEEQMSGSKHIQLVSGASLFSFWLATFVTDFLFFLIPGSLMIVIVEAVQLSFYTEGSAIWFLLLALILYEFAILPYVYVLTSIFHAPSYGVPAIFSVFFLSGILSGLLPPFVGLFSSTAEMMLEMSFYFTSPNFCFWKVFCDLITLSENDHKCSRIDKSIYCLPAEETDEVEKCCLGAIRYAAWEYPGIGRSLFSMALQSIVYFLILGLIETNALSKILHRRSRAHLKAEIRNEEVELVCESGIPQDSDVLCERDRMLKTKITTLLNTDLIIMQNLTKVFGDFTAVDKLSLGIRHGECFGLLGVNGAGKTTCFRILTGELKPSFGNAFIGGKSVWGNGGRALPDIGYCPQSDANLDRLTVRETLTMFALLRSVPSIERDKVVDDMIDRLMLKDDARKLTNTLSCGDKKKLSVAIALIGDPLIIFLDEPTTGMDPVARRIVWNILNALRNTGTTLVMTSHNMEECEALCTRVAIMVNARFQCIGSIQHLKSKFTEGYTLMMKIREENSTEEEGQKKIIQIKSFVSSTFHGSSLKAHHEGALTYLINTPNLSWSQMFGAIERAKHDLEIEDYSVSQTTLNQVFISIARMQCGNR